MSALIEDAVSKRTFLLGKKKDEGSLGCLISKWRDDGFIAEDIKNYKFTSPGQEFKKDIPGVLLSDVYSNTRNDRSSHAIILELPGDSQYSVSECSKLS